MCVAFFWPWISWFPTLFWRYNCSFIVYCKRSLPTPFCEFWHVTALNRHAHVRIRPIVRRIRNPQETRLSETLTYVLATLQDIRASFCALIRRRTIYIYECVGRLQRRLGNGCSAKTLGKSVLHYQTDWSGNGPAGQFWQMESALRFTFTPNGKLEFVPRGQVFPLFFVYCLLLLHESK